MDGELLCVCFDLISLDSNYCIFLLNGNEAVMGRNFYFQSIEYQSRRSGWENKFVKSYN